MTCRRTARPPKAGSPHGAGDGLPALMIMAERQPTARDSQPPLPWQREALGRLAIAAARRRRRSRRVFRALGRAAIACAILGALVGAFWIGAIGAVAGRIVGWW